MKGKNIKIKHHKHNLYNKKKSKGRQVLTVVLTIVILVALAVVGYGIGRPLMEYFQGQNGGTSDVSSESTPPPSTSETSEATSDTSATESSESTPPEEKEDAPFMLSANAARSIETLRGAVEKAKNDGYTSVAVTMKGSNGLFMYKTEIAGVKDSDAVSGTLTAKQIAELITNFGLTPTAKIYTLRDPSSGKYIEDIKYTTNDGFTWVDDAPANGGKSWLCPFNAETAKYIADITSELAKAGFERIIFADTMYPYFRGVDETYLSRLPIKDEQTRISALWSVINAGSAAAKQNGARLLVEVNAADMTAASRLATTAELIGARAQLKNVELLIAYTPDSSGNGYTSAKTFAGTMKGYSGQDYSILLKKNASPDAIAEAEQAFKEEEITVFFE